MKSFFRTFAICLLSVATIACSKDSSDPEQNVPAPIPVPVLPDNWTASHASVTYYGASVDGVGTGYKYWQIILSNKAPVEGMSPTGQAIMCNFAVPEDSTFDKQLPTGEWTLGGSSAISPGVMVASRFLNYDTNTKENQTSGKLVVTKTESAYTLHVELLNNDGKSTVTTLTCTAGSNMILTDKSHTSVMTEDKVQTSTAAVIYCMGGDKEWTTNIYLTPEGMVLDPNTARRELKKGSMIQLVVYTAVGSLPEGTFPINNSLEIGTAMPGVYNDYLGPMGSNWLSYNAGGNEDGFASISSGTIVITKNSENNYSITLDGYDDNYDDPHAIKTTYSGKISIVNDTQTGDFAALVGTYNGGVETASWGVDLRSEEYVKSEGATGEQLLMNIKGPGVFTFSQGIPTGTYPIAEEGDTNVATGVTLKSGSSEKRITSGTVTVKYGNRTRYYVEIDGTLDGAPYKKYYYGVIETIDNHTDNPFEQKDLVLECSWLEASAKGLSGGTQHWIMWYYDKKFVDSNWTTGTGITLDVYAAADAGFVSAKDLPVGTFPVMAATPGTVGIYKGDYSSYQIYVNYANVDYPLTGGSMTISKDAEGYTLALDLVSNGYKITGTTKLTADIIHSEQSE